MLLGARKEALNTQKTVQVIQAWHGDRCVSDACVCVHVHGCASQWLGVHVCTRQLCYFFVCLDTRPSKENTRPLPHEDSTAAGRRQSPCLCGYVIISCFLSKQEGTGAKMEARKALP